MQSGQDCQTDVFNDGRADKSCLKDSHSRKKPEHGDEVPEVTSRDAEIIPKSVANAASAAEVNRNTARRAPRSMTVLGSGASHGGVRRVWHRRACGADESGKHRSWESV